MSIMTKLDHLSPYQKDCLNTHLEDFLEKSQKEEICIYNVGLNPEKSTHPLENFHTLYAFLHLENDSYFVLGRADHFVVEIGYTEADYSDTQDDLLNYVVITCNHKGNRLVAMYKYAKLTEFIRQILESFDDI